MGCESFKNIIDKTDGRLQALQAQVDQFANLEIHIKQHLPKEIAAHCCVTAWSQGQLTIGVANALYMTDLQYRRAELRDSLRKTPAFAGLIGVKFKVIPSIKVTNDMPKNSAQVVSRAQEALQAKPKVLSTQARDALQAAIDALNDDPNKAALKDALSQLIKE